MQLGTGHFCQSRFQSNGITTLPAQFISSTIQISIPSCSSAILRSVCTDYLASNTAVLNDAMDPLAAKGSTKYEAVKQAHTRFLCQLLNVSRLQVVLEQWGSE